MISASRRIFLLLKKEMSSVFQLFTPQHLVVQKRYFFFLESSRWDLSSQMVSKPLEALFEWVFKVLWHFNKKNMKICMRPWIGRLRFYGAVLSQTKLQNNTTPKIHKNQNYQKLGLGLNFKKYNSSFAPASQQRIKRLNQSSKKKKYEI